MQEEQDHLNIKQLYEQLERFPENAIVPLRHANFQFFNIVFPSESANHSYPAWYTVADPMTDTKWNVIQINRDDGGFWKTTVKKLKEVLSPFLEIHPEAIVLTTDKTAFTLSDSIKVSFDEPLLPFRAERLERSEINPKNWWRIVLKNPQNEFLLKAQDPEVVKALFKKANAVIPEGCCVIYLQIEHEDGRWIPSTDLDSWNSGSTLIKHSKELEPGHCSSS